jgi:hypothetical protein
MEYHYYILQNGTSTNKQGLKSGEFIVRIPSYINIPFSEGNGPYKSLKILKKNSPIFKILQRTNTRRAQQILREENISTIDKLIATPKGTTFKKEVVDAFIHSTIGRIKKGNLTGIHFFDPKKVRILETLDTNETTKVFKAKFEFYDSKTGKWIVKKNESTFFPKDWNLATLLMECKFAFDRIKKGEFKDGKIKSITKSNIEIEMVITNGKLKSLYPLI